MSLRKEHEHAPNAPNRPESACAADATPGVSDGVPVRSESLTPPAPSDVISRHLAAESSDVDGRGVSEPSADRSWMRDAALLLTGQAFSLLGSSVVQYAIWWWIVLRERTGASLLLATLFGVVPQAVVSIFGGSLADRYDRRLLVMLPDALIALVTVALSVGFAMDWVSLGMIYVALLLRSAGGGVQAPAVQSFIPDVVPEKGLLRVNSLYGVINSANLIVAPAVAAVLINLVPLWSILLVDVTTAFVGVAFVAMIRTPRMARGRTGSAEGASDGGVSDGASDAAGPAVSGVRRALADLREGFDYVMARPRLRGVVLSDGLICFIAVAPMNLTMLLMTREFEGVDLNLGFVNLTTASDKLAANELGWSLGMLAGGALMSTVGAKRVRDTMRMLAFGMTATGLAVVGLGLCTNLLAYLVVDVFAGVADALCVGPIRTILQSESDPRMTGRVFGLDVAFSSFGMPLGMLVFAPLADVVPVSWVFVAGGVLSLPIGAYLFALARRTRRNNVL